MPQAMEHVPACRNRAVNEIIFYPANAPHYVPFYVRAYRFQRTLSTFYCLGRMEQEQERQQQQEEEEEEERKKIKRERMEQSGK